MPIVSHASARPSRSPADSSTAAAVTHSSSASPTPLLCALCASARATRLLDEAEALIPMSSGILTGQMLVAKAEVARLAGALDEATASLQKALRLYEDRGAVPYAARTRVMLAS